MQEIAEQTSSLHVFGGNQNIKFFRDRACRAQRAGQFAEKNVA